MRRAGHAATGMTSGSDDAGGLSDAMPLHPPTFRTPRRPLMERLAEWRAYHDPGAIDTTRALHLALCFTLMIFIGYVTALGFGLNVGMQTTFPLMAGAGSLSMITFTPAASRAAEAQNMWRVFAICASFLVVLTMVGPGDGETNALIQKLLLIPLSACALFMRSWGMPGQRLGMALTVIATVGTVVRPGHEEAAWLLAAYCQGALIAAMVRLSPWRPSAVAAYVRTTHDMEAAVAAYLREMSEAVREGYAFPDEAAQPVEALRGRVWAALANANAEAPEAQEEFEALRAKLYRLRVAVELLANCIPAGPNVAEGGPDDWRRPFSAATDYLARRLEAMEIRDPQGQERFIRATGRLRACAFSPTLPAEARFALLRALTAFERLLHLVDAIAETENAPFPSKKTRPGPNSFPPRIPMIEKDKTGRKVLSAPMKVAIQGLLATGLTTSLDVLIGLDHAYWATMTVIFVLGNSLGETYMRVRYRTLGTLIGVLLGIGVFLTLGHHLLLLASACMAAQVIALITQKDRYDVSSAAVGFSVVLGLHLISGLGTEGMLARIYETAIGAGAALIISFLVLPVYLTDQLRPELHDILKRCHDVLASWWPHRGPAQSVAPLAQIVREFDLRVPNLGAEHIFGHSAGNVANLISTLDVVLTYLALLEDTAHRLALTPVNEEVLPVLETARSRILTAFEMASAAAIHQHPAEIADAGAAAAAPALDAAISTALSLADDPAVQGTLPLVADYLAYSETLMRPLRELRASMQNQSPWWRENIIAADQPPHR